MKLTQGARGNARRIAPGGPLLVEPARARVDQPRGQPPPHALLHRRAGGITTRRSGTCSRRPSCGSCISANPDGYQYTFDHERLWRKNLRDNDGDGEITAADGVDPNRNFDEHWGYDNEGSSPDPADETYRGPSAASEPETQAMQGLIDRIKPKFQSNFHSFGEWLLYPQGWQVGTLDADYPIYVATGGTDDAVSGGIDDDSSAIPGFNRGSRPTRSTSPTARRPTTPTSMGAPSPSRPSSARARRDRGSCSPTTSSWSRRSSSGRSTSRLGLARSAARSRRIRSRRSGSTIEPFYLDPDDIDPQNGQTSLFDFKFERLLRRSAGGAGARQAQPRGRHAAATGSTAARTRPRRPANGRAASATASATATYYHVVRGEVTGTEPGRHASRCGSRAAARAATRSPTRPSPRRQAACSCLSAEDYTGASPGAAARGPHYLSLLPGRAGGERRRVRRLRRRRPRPHRAGQPRRAQPLRRGRLVHGRRHRHARARLGRRATRRGWRCRSCTRCATTSTRAGACSTRARRPASSTRPVSARSSTTRSVTGSARADPAVQAGCLAAVGVRDSQGDPIEYFFGAAITTAGRRQRPGDRRAVRRARHRRSARAAWTVRVQRRRQRPEPRDEQLVHRDRRLPPGHGPGGQFPQFESWPAAEYLSGLSGPFDPHTGAVVHVVGSRRRGVQAADADDRRSRRAARRCRSGRATTSSSTSTT